jgi:hypothetical protein
VNWNDPLSSDPGSLAAAPAFGRLALDSHGENVLDNRSGGLSESVSAANA